MLKRKGYDDMHTLVDSVEIKKLDPKDADEIEKVKETSPEELKQMLRGQEKEKNGNQE